MSFFLKDGKKESHFHLLTQQQSFRKNAGNKITTQLPLTPQKIAKYVL